MNIAQSFSHQSLSSPAVWLSKALDVCLIPIAGFVIVIKAYDVFDLHLFILAVALIYGIKNLIAGDFADSSARLNWMDGAVLLVVVVEAICYATSTYRANSLRHLAETLFLFFFFVLIRFNLRRDYQRLAIYALISGLGFWVSSRGLYSFWRHDQRLAALGFNNPIDFKHLFGMVGADSYVTGEHITMFLLFLPFPLVLFFKSIHSKLLKWLCLCPVVTLLLILLVTFSRAVYAAVFAFCVVAGWLLYRYRLFSAKRIIGFNLLFGLLLAVCLSPVARPVLTTLMVVKTESQVRSLEGRAHLWGAAGGLVKQHLWTGIGAYNFPLRYTAYTEDYTAAVLSPFNYFLQILVERGLLGLLAYGLLLVAFFKVAKSRLAQPGERWQQAAIIFFIASFAAVLVRDLTYSSILINKSAGVLLWFLFAGLARQANAKGGSAV